MIIRKGVEIKSLSDLITIIIYKGLQTSKQLIAAYYQTVTIYPFKVFSPGSRVCSICINITQLITLHKLRFFSSKNTVRKIHFELSK